MREDIWRSKVNAFIAYTFVGTFSLGALLIIWHAAFGHNPLADFIYNVSIVHEAGGF